MPIAGHTRRRTLATAVLGTAAIAAVLGTAAIAAVLAGCGGSQTTSHARGRPPPPQPLGYGKQRFIGGGVPSPTQRRLGWRRTDFSEHSVPLPDFVSGGTGKNGIPALERPRFTSVRAANRLLDDREAVAVVQLQGEARAYPIAILIWHEIVDDRIAGRPVAVTYCPLCNSTVVLDRRVGGRTLDLRATGALRNANLVMYDRQTQSWWQQITGEAVVGELTSELMRVLPSEVLSWGTFKRV